MDKAEKQIQEMLEHLADARVHMESTGKVLASLLLSGAVPSADLILYNVKTAQVFNLESSLLAILREGGMNGLPPSPPFPLIFALKGFTGTSAIFPPVSVTLPVFATTDDFTVLSSPTEPFMPNMAFNQFNFDDGNLGWAIPVIAGVAILGYSAYKIFTAKFDSDAKREAIRAQAQTYSEWFAQRRYESELRFEVYTNCTATSGVVDFARCVTTANSLVKDTPIPGDYLKYLGKPKTGDEGNSVFWWIGVVVSIAAVAAGGIYLYRRRKNKQLTQ